jgi:hypothetical protein
VQLGRPDLAGRTPPHEHRAERLPGADLGAHDVRAARRAEAAVLFAGTEFGSGHGVTPSGESQLLLRDVDL